MHAGYTHKPTFDDPTGQAEAEWEREWAKKQAARGGRPYPIIFQEEEKKPMSDKINRPQIYSHITKSRFLHIEDSLEIGKIRLFAGAYQRGQGASVTACHFLDLDDARVLLTDMAQGQHIKHDDFKGTRKDGQPVSRVCKITAKEERYWIELRNGPGQIMGKGAVKPAGDPTAVVSIPLSLHEARRLALAVLAYIQAWEANNLPALDIAPPEAEPNEEMVTARSAARTDPPTSHHQPVAKKQPAMATTRPPRRPVQEKPSHQPPAALVTETRPGPGGDVTNIPSNGPDGATAYSSIVAQAVALGVPLATIEEITRVANGPGGWACAAQGLTAAMTLHTTPDSGRFKGGRQALIARIEALRNRPGVKTLIDPPADPLWKYTWSEDQLVQYGQQLKGLAA